jgi:hypothetical protein
MTNLCHETAKNPAKMFSERFAGVAGLSYAADGPRQVSEDRL